MGVRPHNNFLFTKSIIVTEQTGGTSTYSAIIHFSAIEHPALEEMSRRPNIWSPTVPWPLTDESILVVVISQLPQINDT